ncbi:hypothetical protein PHJA_000124300 [Phtheirospermum japonicum]|uniref:Uncharacterized protein n=1 Tax=Phtheirospermum japonicum TaxID=374723 RepID=A0A830B3A4_9LAMI|nr:hypothetical protein PHJA_000124300 [Phtheirospermum japonicum]
MGRGRGKGKKQFAIGRDDYVSGEDEKLPMKRRGRPQKPVKDEMASADEVEIIEGEEYEDEKGKKRKRSKTADLINEENGLGTKTNANALIKSLSFRHIGSRRKNKPRRAAEVGVECK